MKSPGRTVEPELLDELPPQDKRALRSRRDLRLINLAMNHPSRMARTLLECLPPSPAPRIVELGAGDGHFLFSVAARLQRQWPHGEAILVDRLNSFDPSTSEQFNRIGWRNRTETKTALDWLRQAGPGTADAIIFNLFLHQFRDEELVEMFRLAAGIAGLLVALEPRRSWLSRLSGKFLWVIGCNAVTLHDADISIRAGFNESEVSALWPEPKNWKLTERSAGLFSHLFIAHRASR